MSFWWIVLFSTCVASACHPQCSWQCDNPTAAALCTPTCADPVCQVLCEEPTDPAVVVTCEAPNCIVQCPLDMCESDACPVCETVCGPPVCTPADVVACATVCQATNCSWTCVAPIDFPLPTCVVACEKPACDIVDFPINRTSGSHAAAGLSIAALVMLLLLAN